MSNIIFTREHTEYKRLKQTWTKIRDAYSGGKPYVDSILVQHPSENEAEYKERKKRSYYLNYPRKVANKITELILSKEPQRQGADVHIIEDFNRKGLNVNEVMRQARTLQTLYSRAWLFVDAPAVTGTVTVAQKKDEKLRPYCTALGALSVPDWYFSEDGTLEWAIIEEIVQIKDNPTVETKTIKRRTLWTKTFWQRYESNIDIAVDKQTVSVSKPMLNALGKVPLISMTDITESEFGTRPVMEDIVRVSDAITLGESELLTTIIKQIYGLLVVPESFLMTQMNLLQQLKKNGHGSENAYYEQAKAEFATMISRSNCITESADEEGIARYISPDGMTTKAIEEHNDRLRNHLYELVGFFVRTDTTQRESADSKAWDAQDLTAYLQSKADALEQAEHKAWEMMNMYDGTITVPKMSYNRDFSVKDFKSLIMGLVELGAVDGGETYQKILKMTALDLANKVSKIPEEMYQEAIKEIENSEPCALIINPDAIAFAKPKDNGDKDESLKATTDFDKGSASVTTTQEA